MADARYGQSSPNQVSTYGLVHAVQQDGGAAARRFGGGRGAGEVAVHDHGVRAPRRDDAAKVVAGSPSRHHRQHGLELLLERTVRRIVRTVEGDELAPGGPGPGPDRGLAEHRHRVRSRGEGLTDRQHRRDRSTGVMQDEDEVPRLLLPSAVHDRMSPHLDCSSWKELGSSWFGMGSRGRRSWGSSGGHDGCQGLSDLGRRQVGGAA